MVAETHSQRSDFDPDDVSDFLAAAAGVEGPDDLVGLTLADCGFEGELGVDQLLRLLGEEFGERTLAAIDDPPGDTTLATEFVAEVLASLAPNSTSDL